MDVASELENMVSSSPLAPRDLTKYVLSFDELAEMDIPKREFLLGAGCRKPVLEWSMPKGDTVKAGFAWQCRSLLHKAQNISLAGAFEPTRRSLCRWRNGAST